jgi:hypothetical protein
MCLYFYISRAACVKTKYFKYIVPETRLPSRYILDGDSRLESLHHVDVDGVVGVSEVHTSSVIRIGMNKLTRPSRIRMLYMRAVRG